jgi:hypothetical protein
MKLLVSVCLLATLVGCASYWDGNDPCQTRLRPQGYQKPAWCGASDNRVNIYNNGGSIVGYIKR